MELQELGLETVTSVSHTEMDYCGTGGG